MSRNVLALFRVAPAKDAAAGRHDACGQRVVPALQHELEEGRRALRKLRHLHTGLRIQQSEAGVYVPLGAVDAQAQVNFDRLHATGVLAGGPRVGLQLCPGRAHRKEGRVRHGLRVGRDGIVLVVAHVYVARLEARENPLDHAHLLVRRAVLDQHEWLPAWVDVRAVQRVARHNVYVARQVRLKRLAFRCLDARLACDDGADLGRWPILFDDAVDVAGLDGVHDKVALARHEMSVPEHREAGALPLLLQRLVLLRTITYVDVLPPSITKAQGVQPPHIAHTDNANLTRRRIPHGGTAQVTFSTTFHVARTTFAGVASCCAAAGACVHGAA